MPLFDIKCLECHVTFEHLCRNNDILELQCPTCKSAQLEKLIGTPAAFILKGHGFYKPSPSDE